jgi:vanillate O-demethylase monooxygenase subunit
VVTVTRWMKNIEAPPFWARQLGKDGNVDRWQIIRCEVPSIVVGDVGVAPAGTGAPEGDRSQGVNGAFLAAVTPESEATCHYHWNFVRLFHREDEELTRKIQSAHVNNGQGVYDEDVVFLEAQQRAIGRHPRQPFYNLNIDAGPMWCRRLIDGMIAKETQRPALQAAE